MELAARKRKVNVLNQDKEYVALEDGSLSDEEKFVSYFLYAVKSNHILFMIVRIAKI